MARKSSKKSDRPEPATPPPAPAAPPKPANPTSALPEGARELIDLVVKARAGNASVLPRLRQVLDAHPEVWRFAGDLARMTQQTWINELTGGDPLAAESMARQAAAMKVELEGPAPTALERLLVSQIVACWLETQSAQITLGLPAETLRQARHSIHHADVARRQFLAATKALTAVRALQLKAVMPTAPLKVFDKQRKQA